MEHGHLTSTILGAAIEVHKTLGAGYLESVYANALDIVLRERAVCFVREHEIELRFHGALVGHHRIDLLIENKVLAWHYGYTQQQRN